MSAPRDFDIWTSLALFKLKLIITALRSWVGYFHNFISVFGITTIYLVRVVLLLFMFEKAIFELDMVCCLRQRVRSARSISSATDLSKRCITEQTRLGEVWTPRPSSPRAPY